MCAVKVERLDKQFKMSHDLGRNEKKFSLMTSLVAVDFVGNFNFNFFNGVSQV